MNKFKNIEGPYNIFEEILHNVTNWMSDKAAALLERISPTRTEPKEQKDIAPAKSSGAPVFTDATRSKTIAEAPKGKPQRSAYPDGKTVITDDNGTTHVILPTNATAVQTNSTFGAGFKMPEPVYHVKKDARLNKHDKEVLKKGVKNIFKDKEGVVKTVQVDLGGNMTLSMNPSQLKTFIQTAHSLSKEMQEDLPVKQKQKKNAAEIVDTKAKTDAPVAAQETPVVNVVLLNQNQGGLDLRMQG